MIGFSHSISPEALIVDTRLGGTLPQRQTPESVGYDLVASHDAVLLFGDRVLVPTGITVSIPPGYVGMVCPRSGLALKHGITVLNAPGIIDSDYRGEVGVILINLGVTRYQVKAGDRIAQLVIMPCPNMWLVHAEIDSETERGTGGFGSTGR